jgi:DNA-binding transcriptional LysR family regulator
VDLTLRQLVFLREVARHEQVTRAAAALYVSQPTVSSGLQQLERQAGLPLLEQVGRRVKLTEAGRLLAAHAERILAEVADAERALAGLREGVAGRLALGASTTPGTYLLPALLGAFAQAHRQVEVVLEIGDTRAVLEWVVAGRFDLGVVGEAAFAPTLQVAPFRRERLVLIMPPAHPLAGRRRLALADLAEQPFVLREPGSSTREVLERALHERGFRPRVVMELGSGEAVKRTVSAGLGISFISEHAVDLEQRAGDLVTRSLPDLPLERGLYVVRRRSLHLTPLHRRLLQALDVAPGKDEPGGEE